MIWKGKRFDKEIKKSSGGSVMGEVIRTVAKKTEEKSRHSVSQRKKADSSHLANPSADLILFLQRTAGNHAVQKLLNANKNAGRKASEPQEAKRENPMVGKKEQPDKPTKDVKKLDSNVITKQKASEVPVKSRTGLGSQPKPETKSPAVKAISENIPTAHAAAKAVLPLASKGGNSDEIMKNFVEADASQVAATYTGVGDILNKGLAADLKEATDEIPPVQAELGGVKRMPKTVPFEPVPAPVAEISRGITEAAVPPQKAKPYQNLAPLQKNTEAVKITEQTQESFSSSLENISTHDPGLNTSVGERPQFDATGDANPYRAVLQSKEGHSQVQQQMNIVAELISSHPGQEQIQPVSMNEQVKVVVSQAPVAISTKTPDDMKAYAALPIQANVHQAADAQMAPLLKKSMAVPNAEVAKAKAQRDKNKEASIKNTQQQAEKLSEQAQQEQEAVVQKSRSKVFQEQQKGLEESKKRLETFNAETIELQASTIKDVNKRIESDQKQADEHLAAAEVKAEAERQKGEQEAAAKKDELEKNSKEEGWWSKAVSAIKSAVEFATKAIDAVFDAVRSVVKVIIEAARSFVVGIIEAGRKWVVSKLEAFGSWLKDKVNKYLKDFPALAARINAAIDSTVNAATRTINAVANKLKRGVNTLANTLGKAIDSVLNAFQGALKFAVALYGVVLTGDFGAAAKMVFLAACQVLGIPPENILGILNKAGSAISIIFKDPVGFLKNLLTALGKGFTQFAGNILKHLVGGLMGWLFGALEEAGIKVPAEFSLKAIFGLVMDVLGLTYARIRAKAVKLIGEKNVEYIEKVWSFISKLITEGPAGLWEHIKEYLGNLKDTIIDAVKDWVVTKIVQAAITKLVSMFNPVGAIVQAVLATYNTLMFFIERIKQIMSLVEAITSSVYKIAVGAIGDAANWVENAMVRTVPVIISFLARLIGLGGISEKIKSVIHNVQDTVDKAIDKVIEKAVKMVKSAGKSLGFGKEAEGSSQAGEDHTEIGKTFKATGKDHRVWVEVKNNNPQLMMASDKQLLNKFISDSEQRINTLRENEQKRSLLAKLQLAKSTSEKIQTDAVRAVIAANMGKTLNQEFDILIKELTDLLIAASLSNYKPGDIGYVGDPPMMAYGWLMISKRGDGESELVSKPVNQSIESLRQMGVNIEANFDGGHLIGAQLGGSNKRENIVPMESRMNRSWQNTFEGSLRERLENKEMIHAEVRVKYTNRPFDRIIDEKDLVDIEMRANKDANLSDLLKKAQVNFQKIPEFVYFTIKRCHPDSCYLESIVENYPFDTRRHLALTIKQANTVDPIGGSKDPAREIFKKHYVGEIENCQLRLLQPKELKGTIVQLTREPKPASSSTHHPIPINLTNYEGEILSVRGSESESWIYLADVEVQFYMKEYVGKVINGQLQLLQPQNLVGTIVQLNHNSIYVTRPARLNFASFEGKTITIKGHYSNGWIYSAKISEVK